MDSNEVEAVIDGAVNSLRSQLNEKLSELNSVCEIHSYLLQNLYTLHFRGKETDFQGMMQATISRSRFDANNSKVPALAKIHKYHEELLKEFRQNVSARLRR